MSPTPEVFWTPTPEALVAVVCSTTSVPASSVLEIVAAAALSMVRSVGSTSHVPPCASILAAPICTVPPEVSIAPAEPPGPCASSVPATLSVPLSAMSRM